MKHPVAAHDCGINRPPPSLPHIQYVSMPTAPKRVGDTVNWLITSRADVVQSVRVPLPAFDKSDALGDNSITNPIRTAHQFVVVGYVGTYPLSRLSIFGPVFVSQ